MLSRAFLVFDTLAYWIFGPRDKWLLRDCRRISAADVTVQTVCLFRFSTWQRFLTNKICLFEIPHSLVAHVAKVALEAHGVGLRKSKQCRGNLCGGIDRNRMELDCHVGERVRTKLRSNYIFQLRFVPKFQRKRSKSMCKHMHFVCPTGLTSAPSFVYIAFARSFLESFSASVIRQFTGCSTTMESSCNSWSRLICASFLQFGLT